MATLSSLCLILNLLETKGVFASILLLSFRESRVPLEAFADPQLDPEASRVEREFVLASKSTTAVYEGIMPKMGIYPDPNGIPGANASANQVSVIFVCCAGESSFHFMCSHITPCGLTRRQDPMTNRIPATTSAMRPIKTASGSQYWNAVIKIPALSRAKETHTSPTGPREEPWLKRGMIQNATPIANWISQPTNKNSM
ncbi:MAG: hypothetical protein FIB03_10855 [Anaerolineae bacterium]|nr:hypothetical protein [Anaerolineae bacterium]